MMYSFGWLGESVCKKKKKSKKKSKNQVKEKKIEKEKEKKHTDYHPVSFFVCFMFLISL